MRYTVGHIYIFSRNTFKRLTRRMDLASPYFRGFPAYSGIDLFVSDTTLCSKDFWEFGMKESAIFTAHSDRTRTAQVDLHKEFSGTFARFACVSEEEFDQAVQDALRQIGQVFGVDRTYLFRFSSDLERMDNTHDWCAPGIPSFKDRLVALRSTAMPWWQAQIQKRRPVYVSRVAELPQEAEAERLEFQAQGIQSLVCFPLCSPQDILLGFIGMDAVRQVADWSSSELQMLQVLATIISGAIARNDAYRTLQESESRLNQLAGQSRVVVWEVDATGKYTYVSRVIEQVLGYRPDEVVDKMYFYDFIPEEHRPMVVSAALEVMERREPFHAFVNPARSKKGKLVWLSTSGLPLVGEDGTLLGYRGSDTDITERKQAKDAIQEAQERLEHCVLERTAELRETNEALRASHERYRRLVLATRSFVFTVSIQDDKEVRTLHEAGVDIVTGYSASEYEQDPLLWQQTVFPEDMPAVLRHLEAIRTGAPISVIEHRLVHQSGQIRWVRNTSVASMGPEGKLLGYDGLITDITALKEAEHERDSLVTSLHKISRHDSMTGLLNRRGFYEELDRLWEMSLRHPFPIAILILDLDRFKSVNDTHGHLIGDEVIKEYSELVRSLLRESDVICRYAGDELVVILPWTDLPEARRIGERMRQEVGTHVFCRGRHDLKLTVSIGAHAKVPHPGRSSQRLLSLTDRALYRAKQNGRDRLCGSDEFRIQALEKDDPVVPAFMLENHPGRVLVVDDDPYIRRMLERLLSHENYQVFLAENSEQALRTAEREKEMLDLALVDLNLGEENGLTLIARLKEMYPSLVQLVITGQATLDGAVDSLRSGAYDFIQKPVTFPQLSAIMERAMQQRKLLLENRRYQDHLEAMVRQRGLSLSRALEEQKRAYQFTLETMATLIGVRERKTGEHSQRVAKMAVILAAEMGATSEELEQIRRGALLHDIGKMAIPDAILLKPGPLTEEEWDVMKTHPRIGHQLIAENPALKEAAEIVLCHHEHFDGSGYPQGLSGEQICLGGRIFVVADAYDAMRSHRPYKNAMSLDEARSEILRNKGTHFDPYVVEALIRCLPQVEAAGRWVS